nr:toprim domain-containing protein [Faecalibacterium prausnitzii]
MSRRRPAKKIPNPSDFKAAFCRRTYCNPKQIGGIFIAKLIVAEKPSVAVSYAKVLGATSRQDGYLEGNGYLVSWCVGHLVELAPPNVYDAKYVKWSIFIIRRKTVLVDALNPYPAIREKGSSVWAKCSFYNVRGGYCQGK